MALSEEDRRHLEMLEQQLATSDPDLDQKLQVGSPGKDQRQATRMVQGVLIFIAAFTLVIVGIRTEIVLLGAAGFLLMITGGHWFLNGYGLQDGHGDPPWGFFNRGRKA